jgi:tetratricopeptide (TPR) repeat protein
LTDSLERKIRTAEQLARSCDIAAALAIADEVLVEAPSSLRSWMLRAFVHELAENHAAARADLSSAIELEPKEPHLFYTRGRMSYLLGDFADALEDFSEALRLGQIHENDYYDQEVSFWRAATFVALGNFEAARADLSRVNDGFCTWTNGMLTKADLLAQCG